MNQANQTTKTKSNVDSMAISKIESHFGFWLRFVSNHVSGNFKKLVEENGVSVSEWLVIRYLYDGVSSSFELIDTLGMTKGAISKIVTRLEKKQLVERMAVQTDKRAQQIQLTPTGRTLVPKLAAIADQNEKVFFGHLTPLQQTNLIKVMKHVVKLHGLKQLPTE